MEGTAVRGQKNVKDIFAPTGTFVKLVPIVPGKPEALLNVTVAVPNCASPKPLH